MERTDYYRSLFNDGLLFTANSPYLKEKLIELGCPEEKLRVIPMPVDTMKFRPAESFMDHTVIRLISVGRLVKIKGHEYGIRAVGILKSRGCDVQYRIIGVGEEEQRLRSLISELGLEGIVEMEGLLSQDRIVTRMQGSDIFLMTSTYDESGRREAQGLVTGEAQACGLPVVAFRSGGVPSTLLDGETGFLVPENDIDGMAERIEYLIGHPTERQQMAKSARTHVEKNFSLRAMEAHWEGIYADLLE
jgi:colanic acid/amylovoran biosynthesis glycosyltransferase